MGKHRSSRSQQITSGTVAKMRLEQTLASDMLSGAVWEYAEGDTGNSVTLYQYQRDTEDYDALDTNEKARGSVC